MNISSISNNQAVPTSSNNTSYLQKQESNIENQIQQENSSKDDTKTKQVKITQLQSQLQQIQAQMQSSKASVTTSEPIKPLATASIDPSSNNKSSTNNIVDELV